ncbi:hypothetical protein L596_010849 [Steinernema carpocapsae]|uniref:Secreted protein n=1 Tax=Steinernema carpocapsae TaxID=34508 RepID=A0A4U5PJQ2_STECR|nr:hypothetical protein L596_010849 [Steinernema carpocapsae]
MLLFQPLLLIFIISLSPASSLTKAAIVDPRPSGLAFEHYPRTQGQNQHSTQNNAETKMTDHPADIVDADKTSRRVSRNVDKNA